MRMFANVVVVLEGNIANLQFVIVTLKFIIAIYLFMYIDTFQVRFAMRHCVETDYPRYTTFKCHHEPTYLLARQCARVPHTPDQLIDCKLDESLDYLLNEGKSMFGSMQHALFIGDDTYIRPDQLVRWLHSVGQSGVSVYPIIASADAKMSRPNGLPGVRGCKEIHTRRYKLPFMMNRALFTQLGSAATAYGVQSIVQGFNTTYDSAVGVLAWMFGSYHMLIPAVNQNLQQRGILALRPTDMVVYHVRHADGERCDDGLNHKWQPHQKYVQSVAIGCGDLAQPAPRHAPIDRANMYDAWEYYKKRGADIKLNQVGVNGFYDAHVIVSESSDALRHVVYEATNWASGLYEWHTYITDHVYLLNGTRHKLANDEYLAMKVIPRLLPLRGYRETRHGAKYNQLPTEWKPFGIKDCSPPGLRVKTI